MQSRVVIWVLVPLLGFGVVWSGGIVGAIAQENTRQQDNEISQEIEYLSEQARQSYNNKKYSDAINLLERVLILTRRSQDKIQEAYTLMRLGLIYGQLSKHAESVDYYQRSLLVFQKIENTKGAVDVLNNLGIAYQSLGKYKEAISSYKQGLLILRENKDFLGEAGLLMGIGIAYQSLEEYEESISYYKKSLSIFEANNDFEEQAKALANLGIAYGDLGNYETSIFYFEKSLLIFQESKDVAKVADILIRLAESNRLIGRYGKAIIYFSKAQEIYQKSNDYIGEIKSLGGIGNVYLYLNQYDRAILAYKKTVSIAQKNGNLPGVASGTHNLGIVYQLIGQYDEAISLHGSALKIFQKLNDKLGEAQALGSLGDAHLLSSSIDDKSISFLKKALTIYQEVKYKSGEAKTLFSLSQVYSIREKYDDAIFYCQKSIIIFDDLGDRYNLANALSSLGNLLFQAGRFKQAEDSFLKGLATWDFLRSGLTDEQRRSLHERQQNLVFYPRLQQVQVALKKFDLALETSDRGRARAFVELLAAQFAGERLENAITKQKVERLSIAEIQQVAKTQMATLIQYSIVSEKSLFGDLYIYVVQPDGRIQFRQADLTTLGKSITDFVNASRDGLGVRGRTEEADILVTLSPEKERELQEKRDRSLRQLHQLLIEPIADLLPKNESDRVIFMPQGELFLVPFPALLNDKNQPLITQHTILTAPSIQTLDLTHKTAQKRPKSNRPALVIGNPTMPAVTTVIGNPPQKLTPLPGSEIEANAIAQQLNTQAMTGANARKDTVMQKMQNAGIIHLATHGLLDSFKGDTPGAIALAPNGTNQPNDGLLTSGEIFDLKLNAELVVLSACDTGRGDITGDGVIGLSRSLFVAGVPSVIVSLWKVPDESTAFLMTEFYRNWKDRKLDKAQSLRQAMLTTRDKYPQPLHWTAFTLIGEAE